MLHKEEEIISFLKAKKRIEAWGKEKGWDFTVGVFLYYIANGLSPKNRELQLENQKKYHLPLVHAQAPVLLENSLSYTGKDSLLEIAIEQCAKLRKEDPLKMPLDIDVHVGVVVFDEEQIPKKPCIYTIDEFLEQKNTLLSQSATRFNQLRKKAAAHNLGLLVENARAVIFGMSHVTQKPRMHFVPFNKLNTLLSISSEGLVLDIAHWAGGRFAPLQFKKNNSESEQEQLFAIEGITSWEEYLENNPDYEQYLAHTKVLHMSNATGIGVSLKEYPELEKKWGSTGTIQGLLKKKDLKSILEYASKKNIPIAIEVDYDIKNIPKNNFSEADDFLKYILD